MALQLLQMMTMSHDAVVNASTEHHSLVDLPCCACRSNDACADRVAGLHCMCAAYAHKYEHDLALNFDAAMCSRPHLMMLTGFRPEGLPSKK